MSVFEIKQYFSILANIYNCFSIAFSRAVTGDRSCTATHTKNIRIINPTTDPSPRAGDIP
jgi:hypothetical protein